MYGFDGFLLGFFFRSVNWADGPVWSAHANLQRRKAGERFWLTSGALAVFVPLSPDGNTSFCMGKGNISHLGQDQTDHTDHLQIDHDLDRLVPQLPLH